MSRIPTVNYGADTDTQFQYATTDDDQFDRELDIYRLSLAVERHDHSANRGLPVARVAPGIIDAAAMAPLSVGTTILQDLSVTNGKLATGAVTRDKITMPLVQPTNDFAGGVRLRETANTYTGGWYIAANGLAVYGVGTVAGSIGTNLILGQAGQVSVGTLQGGALFNVMQAVNTLGGGLRVYNTNTGFFGDLYNDSSGWPVIAANGNICCLFEPATRGGLVIGTSHSPAGKLSVFQAASTAAEGIYQTNGTGIFRAFVDTNHDINLQSVATNLLLKHGSNALVPTANNVTELGQTGTRWSKVWAVAADFSGAVTFGGGLGAISVTGITLTGSTPLITGVNQIQMAGTAAGSFIMPVGSGNTAFGDATHRFAAVYCTSVETSGTSHFGGDATPVVDGATSGVALGSASFRWGGIYLAFAGTAFKPGGGSWTDPSDDRTKMSTKFRPYQSGLDQVLALDPTYYTYNGDYSTPRGEEYIGLRAQATQKIAPELVGKTTRSKKDGDKLEEILTIDASALPYMLINAIKTLEARVRELEARRN